MDFIDILPTDEDDETDSSNGNKVGSPSEKNSVLPVTSPWMSSPFSIKTTETETIKNFSNELGLGVGLGAGLGVGLGLGLVIIVIIASLLVARFIFHKDVSCLPNSCWKNKKSKDKTGDIDTNDGYDNAGGIFGSLDWQCDEIPKERSTQQHTTEPYECLTGQPGTIPEEISTHQYLSLRNIADLHFVEMEKVASTYDYSVPNKIK